MKDLFASAALVFAVVLAAPASDAPLEIGDGACRLRIAGAEAEILGSGGQSLMRLTGLKGCWSDFETDGGTAVRAGADRIRMDYRMKGAEAALVALSAVFTCRSNRVAAVAAFHGRPLAVELSTDRPFNLATAAAGPTSARFAR